jgi:hypothetical protein
MSEVPLAASSLSIGYAESCPEARVDPAHGRGGDRSDVRAHLGPCEA